MMPPNIAQYFAAGFFTVKNVSNKVLEKHTPVVVTGCSRPDRNSITVTDGGEFIMEVDEPAVDNPTALLFTGVRQIKPDGYGPASLSHVVYSRFRGTLVTGDTVGVEAQTDYVQEGYHGYRVVGDIDTRLGICALIRDGFVQGTPGQLAKTDAQGISGLSGMTPGEGTVTLQYRNPSTGDIEAVTDADGNDVTTTCYSFVTTTSGTSRFIYMDRDAWGDWWYVAEACP